jgi:general secretion pathway protein L
MAAQILRRGQAIVWVPPRAIGERAFATEASLLAMLPIAATEKLVSGPAETAVTVEGSGSAARYARLSLDALPSLKSVTLVFDARDVTLLRAKLPPLSGARLQQALPNVVEDLLLQDAQQCGFAVGPRIGEGERVIAAIDRGWLEHVVGAFERRGAKVAAAWPAQLALPAGESGSALACVNDGLALRTGPLDGLGWNASAHPAHRADAIVSLIEAAWGGEGVAAGPAGAIGAASAEGGPSASFAERELPDEEQAGGVRRLTVYVEAPDWQPSVMIAAARAGFVAEIRSLPLPLPAPVDLLAARRGSKARRWVADIDWRAWRLPGAFAAATAVVALAGLNFQWAMLAQERDELRSAVERRYRQTFPDAQVIVDPVLQMERQVAGMRTRAGLSGPEDFVPLLARFSQALGAQAVDSMAGVEYRDGRLRVRFQPGQFESRAVRDTLIQACQRLGLQMRFDSEREPTATVALLR